MKAKQGRQGKKRARTQSKVTDLGVKDGARAVKGGSATTDLMKACATGSHIKEAVITH